MEMDWQARQLGLDACSESLARTILHTPAIYRGANQGGATLIKKESREKKVLIARHMTCCPASSASSDVDRPCRWSLPTTFFRYVKNRKIQIQPNPIWLIRPSSLNFIITPNCFSVRKNWQTDFNWKSCVRRSDRFSEWWWSSWPEREVIQNCSCQNWPKKRTSDWFLFIFPFFANLNFVIIDDEPCGNLRFRTQRYEILVCQ